MTGLIWFVQVVHYPFTEKLAQQDSTVSRVAYAMDELCGYATNALKMMTALYFVSNPLPNTAVWSWWVGLVLLGIIWASTGLLQVPAHTALLSDFTVEITKDWSQRIGSEPYFGLHAAV